MRQLQNSRLPLRNAKEQQHANKLEQKATSSLSLGVTAPTTPRVFTGRCVSVLDGDTLLLLSGETNRKIHLYAIDAPEKTQPFGRQSKASLWELAFGQTLTIYPITGSEEEADLVSGWGFAGKMCLNTEQMRLGSVWWDRYGAPQDSKVAALEAQARSLHRGLWQDKSPIAPWLWRAASTNERMEVPMRTSP